MKKGQSRNLVIDASVARASGGKDATHQTSIVTRNLLQSVLTICHKAVMTPAIRDEWNQHQSNFARKWRRSMVARGKLVAVNVGERRDIREQVEAENITPEQKNAMLKDCHLIEAAISTDKRIISLDDTARNLFVGLSEGIADMQDILWVNPVSDTEKVMTWLEDMSNEAQWNLYIKVN
jgi:hypothetical protein